MIIIENTGQTSGNGKINLIEEKEGYLKTKTPIAAIASVKLYLFIL